MGARSKFAGVRSGAHRRAAKSRAGSRRRAADAPEAWEQTAQLPEERHAEIDCQRIVDGEGRSLYPYYDDYN